MGPASRWGVGARPRGTRTHPALLAATVAVLVDHDHDRRRANRGGLADGDGLHGALHLLSRRRAPTGGGPWAAHGCFVGGGGGGARLVTPGPPGGGPPPA